jgi:hypothetical protein
MSGMTPKDRDQLIRLLKARARQGKAEAAQREAVLLAEIEDQLAAEYSSRDELWAEAVAIAEEAAAKANAAIQAACLDLGIPARHAPVLMTGWASRSRTLADPARRGELRKLAQTKLAALTKTAKTMIDAEALEQETALIAGGLETDDARAVLAALPTVEQLMPSLSLDDIGVKHWQPPEDAAGRLLTPSSPADRKRRRVLRAIEANPGASARAIAEIAGVDHKTVGKLRAEGGESPGEAGEIPTDGEVTDG